MPTTDDVDPQTDRRKARIAGAIMGVCLACVGALLGGYGDWVGNALEGAIVCGIAGAFVGPAFSATGSGSRKILIVTLSLLLASLAGGANLMRNSGWGQPDVLIQARLDPMASRQFAGYRQCSLSDQTGALGGPRALELSYETGKASREQAMATAIRRATDHGWTRDHVSNGIWYGHRPRIPGFSGQHIQLTIEWSSVGQRPMLLGTEDVYCHLLITISDHAQ